VRIYPYSVNEFASYSYFIDGSDEDEGACVQELKPLTNLPINITTHF